MNGCIDPSIDYLDQLGKKLGKTWPAISAARIAAQEVRNLIFESVSARLGPYADGDADLIAFGSLARDEWTSGSDVDWTLLVDGQAKPEHRSTARSIATAISATVYRQQNLKLPGTEGIFGKLAFSHDVVHHIGGQIDSNRNTTQRILLLLESAPIRQVNSGGVTGPYERTTAQILYRYLHDDTNFARPGENESRIPRFLLNDIVRYWRTMCVDFAYKEWEQAGEKWALRNVKLRMSRKLLFVSALLTIFSCYKNDSLRTPSLDASSGLLAMQKHLLQFVRSTPLNVLCWSLIGLNAEVQAGILLDHYDQYLARLNDPSIREHLEQLPADKAYCDNEFLALRKLSHAWQESLRTIFFVTESELRDFTFDYGVF